MEQVRFAEGKKRLGQGRSRVFRSVEIDRLFLHAQRHSSFASSSKLETAKLPLPALARLAGGRL
jgi:hypothetical protein